MNKLKVKSNDTIMVITGKDKGKRGKVIRVFPEMNKIVVADINLRKKALREQDKVMNQNFAMRESPIHVSNVLVVCPNCKKPTKIGKRAESGHARFCKRCDKNID